MAKLYWRVKRDGKWTWTACSESNTEYYYFLEDAVYKEEEE